MRGRMATPVATSTPRLPSPANGPISSPGPISLPAVPHVDGIHPWSPLPRPETMVQSPKFCYRSPGGGVQAGQLPMALKAPTSGADTASCHFCRFRSSPVDGECRQRSADSVRIGVEESVFKTVLVAALSAVVAHVLQSLRIPSERGRRRRDVGPARPWRRRRAELPRGAGRWRRWRVGCHQGAGNGAGAGEPQSQKTDIRCGALPFVWWMWHGIGAIGPYTPGRWQSSMDLRRQLRRGKAYAVIGYLEMRGNVVGIGGPPGSIAAPMEAARSAQAMGSWLGGVACWHVPTSRAVTHALGMVELEEGARQLLPANMSTSLFHGQPRQALMEISGGSGTLAVGRRGYAGFAGILPGFRQPGRRCPRALSLVGCQRRQGSRSARA